jgi:hypothetical protein
LLHRDLDRLVVQTEGRVLAQFLPCQGITGQRVIDPVHEQ